MTTLENVFLYSLKPKTYSFLFSYNVTEADVINYPGRVQFALCPAEGARRRRRPPAASSSSEARASSCFRVTDRCEHLWMIVSPAAFGEIKQLQKKRRLIGFDPPLPGLSIIEYESKLTSIIEYGSNL